ncbi:MAG: SUMF1/EgtB/PvdO family nonheme iron enzyme [Gammaproteobacteria bacterium]
MSGDNSKPGIGHEPRRALSPIGRADLARAQALYGEQLSPTLAGLLGFEYRPRSDPGGESDSSPAGDDSAADGARRADDASASTSRTTGPGAVRFWAVTASSRLDLDAPGPEGHEPECAMPERPRRIVPYPFLASPAALLPRLREALALRREADGVDVPEAVGRIARAERLTPLPRETRKGWGANLTVVQDCSAHLIPFRRDQGRVADWLGHVFADTGFRPAWYRDELGTPRAHDGAPLEIEAGEQVLVLGDLGVLARDGGRARRRWRRFGAAIAKRGGRAVALVPFAPSACPPELARRFGLVCWEHPAPRTLSEERMEVEARPLLHQLALIGRVEPGLLRALRLAHRAPALPAAVEAWVWQHPGLRQDFDTVKAVRDELTPRWRARAEADVERRVSAVRVIRAQSAAWDVSLWLETVLNLGAWADEAPHDGHAAEPPLITPRDRRDALTLLRHIAGRVDRLRERAFEPMAMDYVDALEQRLAPRLLEREETRALVNTLARGMADIRAGHGPRAMAAEQDWQLIQRGPRWVFEPGTTLPVTDGFTMGTPLLRFKAPGGVVQLRALDDSEARWQSRALKPGFSLDPEGAGRCLAAAGRTWEIRPLPRPGWASGMGVDDQGLFVDQEPDETRADEPTTGRRSRWTVIEGETIGGGGWISDEELDRFTREGGPRPTPGAHDFGRDEYGFHETFDIHGVPLRFRWVWPGRFLMGSPTTEHARGNDETQHEVTLTRGYWLAETACTQALWEAVMGNNPARFTGEDRPVEEVSWDAVRGFIGKLNKVHPALATRLPSEAEWEMACRAGTSTPFSFGEDISPDRVNYDGNRPYRGDAKGLYREQTVPVGSLPANPWGFHEMHGNVWEWCADRYGAYPAEPVLDPSGPASGGGRVLRGGSWFYDARGCRSAQRNGNHPSIDWLSVGFRLARGPRAAEPQERGARPERGPEPERSAGGEGAAPRTGGGGRSKRGRGK